MKGIYTAGVLDFFLDKGIEFSSCYGVSAGACHLCSYLSKQRGRAYDISVDYLEDKNYCSVSSLLRTGDLFGVKMCYDDIPNRLNPYDYDAFNAYQGRAFAVVTNIYPLLSHSLFPLYRCFSKKALTICKSAPGDCVRPADML